jgi:hypothetical protein
VSKQHDLVAMSANEIEIFLDETKSLNVATMNRHGAPHLTTLWFARRRVAESEGVHTCTDRGRRGRIREIGGTGERGEK